MTFRIRPTWFDLDCSMTTTVPSHDFGYTYTLETDILITVPITMTVAA